MRIVGFEKEFRLLLIVPAEHPKKAPSLVLHFLILLNDHLWMIVDLAVTLWGLFLFYNAMVYALKAREKGIRIMVIILAVLAVLNTFVDVV